MNARKRTLVSGLSVGLALCASAESLGQSYRVKDLGTYSGDSGGSEALAISEAGHVAGISRSDQWLPRPVVWYKGGIWDLGSLGDAGAKPYGIDETPRAVGSSETSSGVEHAVVWDAGVLTDLGTLGGSHSRALDIDATTAVGYASTMEGHHHAAVWQEHGGKWSIRDLAPDGAVQSQARAINTHGQIVGIWNGRPALWEDGERTLLSNAPSGWAHDINDRGDVIGNLAWDGFVWRNGAMSRLGTLGGELSMPYGINTDGTIVGYSETPDFQFRAFLWQDGTMVDLNSLIPADAGWILSVANDINDAGHIVGSGGINGELHGYLLTPVPEAASAPVLIGLLTMVPRRHRRTRAGRAG